MYSLTIASATTADVLLSDFHDLDYEYNDGTLTVIGNYYDICAFVNNFDPGDDINYHSPLNDYIKPVIV